MPKKVTLTCISPEVRDTLKAALPAEKDREAIDSIAICPSSQKLAIDVKGGKRPLSKYNIFIGTCIKARTEGQEVPERMKQCAILWKEEKQSGRV